MDKCIPLPYILKPIGILLASPVIRSRLLTEGRGQRLVKFAGACCQRCQGILGGFTHLFAAAQRVAFSIGDGQRHQEQWATYGGSFQWLVNMSLIHVQLA